MGLTVRMEYITKDGSIFGRTFFYDCNVELYNPDTDEMYTVPVKQERLWWIKRHILCMLLSIP